MHVKCHMDSKEVRHKIVNWIHVVQVRVQWRSAVNTINNVRDP